MPIIGTTPDSIDIAEDRERFQQLVKQLKLKQPPNRTARTEEQALALAREDRLPAGRAAVVRARRPRDGDRAPSRPTCERYMRDAVKVSNDSARCCSTAS